MVAHKKPLRKSFKLNINLYDNICDALKDLCV